MHGCQHLLDAADHREKKSPGPCEASTNVVTAEPLKDNLWGLTEF